MKRVLALALLMALCATPVAAGLGSKKTKSLYEK